MRSTTSVADAEEFQTVGHLTKSVSFGDFLLHLTGQALRQFDHAGAMGTDQMMVMPLFTGSSQFIAGDSITKIKPDHHPHSLQRPKIPIDGGQITFLLAEGQVDFLVGEGVLVTAKDFQDGLAGRGDLSGTPPQLVGQLSQWRLDESSGMRGMVATGFHHAAVCPRFRRTVWSPSDATNSAAQTRTMVGPHGRLKE